MLLFEFKQDIYFYNSLHNKTTKIFCHLIHDIPQAYRLYYDPQTEEIVVVVLIRNGVFIVYYGGLMRWRHYNLSRDNELLDFTISKGDSLMLSVLYSDKFVVSINIDCYQRYETYLRQLFSRELEVNELVPIYHNHRQGVLAARSKDLLTYYSIKIRSNDPNNVGIVSSMITENVSEILTDVGYMTNDGSEEISKLYPCITCLFLKHGRLFNYSNSRERDLYDGIINFHYDSLSEKLYLLKSDGIYCCEYNNDGIISNEKLIFETTERVKFQVTSKHDEISSSRPTKSARH